MPCSIKMNNFNGKIKHLDHIAVDSFTRNVLDSEAFFLSHMHTDHVKGLEKRNIGFVTDHLMSDDRKIYCSETTATLLRNNKNYYSLSEHLEALPLRLRSKVSFPSRGKYIKPFWVTLLPIDHCPGSVMFLFETCNGKRILYTGDFRLQLDDLIGFDALHGPDKQVKTLDHLYLDTTFFQEEMHVLPTLAESWSEVYKLTEEWLDRSDNHVIVFEWGDKLGPPNIHLWLHKSFNMRVHVNAETYEMFKNLPDIEPYVTTRADKTRIHACNKASADIVHPDRRQYKVPSSLPCKSGEYKVRVIRLAAQWFRSYEPSYGIVLCNEDETYLRVLHSMHSSKSEIKSVVWYLKPKDVHPLVVGRGQTSEEIKEELEMEVTRTSQEDPQDSTAISSLVTLVDLLGPSEIVCSENSGTKLPDGQVYDGTVEEVFPVEDDAMLYREAELVEQQSTPQRSGRVNISVTRIGTNGGVSKDGGKYTKEPTSPSILRNRPKPIYPAKQKLRM